MKAVAALLFVFTASLAPAQDKAKDPADVYLDAYMTVQRAEKLAATGYGPEAITEYKKAIEILTDIRKKFPNWHEQIVLNRRTKTVNTLAELEAKFPKR